MFNANLKRYCVILLLCMAVSISANAQSTTQGSIAGTVFDTTGAVVPGATVTIHNNGTNAEIVLTADDSGFYKAALLEPGTYTVTVHSSNFKDYRAESVIVQVSQTTTVEPKLSAGNTGTVVEVSAAAPVLNFESPDFTANLNQRSLQNIPINNRRWSALAMTTPGVVSDANGFGLVAIRGISPLLNNVMIDGADDNDAYFSEERGRTREAYSTSENAVREFQVNTGVYSAEFGRAAGGVINSVTKSGTNQLHGQLYFYDRQSKWGAYQQQTLQTIPVFTAGNPIPTSFNVGVHIKPKDLRKIYGGTIQGPIFKDRLFFTYTYDQHTRIFPSVGAPASPASFFTLPDATLSGTQVCNLTTPGAVGYGFITGTNGTGGAPSAIDQQACTLAGREHLATYALGSATYINGISGLLTDLGNTPRAGYQEINTPKLDWQINSKEHASFLYHRLRWDSPGGVQTSPVVSYAQDTQGNDFVKVDYLVGKLTSLITPNINNELLYQYGRELLPETQQPFTPYTLANLVGTGGNIPFLQNLDTSSNGINIGSPYYSYRKALPDERKWQIGDVLYWNKGNHSIKVGGDILHNYDLINALGGANGSINSAQNGTYVYNNLGNYFADLASKGAAGTCNSTQSSAGSATTAVNGTFQCYNSYQQTFGNPAFDIATLDWGAFIQDNWKFSPRLTLELGIRYDYEHIPNPSAALVNPAIPQTTNHPSDKNNIGPRIGFSYDVYGSGKTVLRGGYGMYYGRILNGVILNTLLNTGVAAGQFTTAFSPVATSGPLSTPPILPNALPNGGAPVTPNAYFLSKTLQNPMVHEFDLAVQQDLGRGTVFSLSYLGSMGRELPNYINTNLNPATRQNSAFTISDVSGKGPIPNGTVINVSQYTSYINPTYQAITGLYSNINSSYNALSAEIQNRTLKSVQFDFSYTWSHALDYLQNANTGVANENWLDPNTTNPRENYGNSGVNVPQRFVGYVLYTVPNYARNGSLLGYLTNGWSVDDSFQMQSGLPYSAILSSNTAKLTTNAIGFGWYGATSAVANIPILGLNNHELPRDIVDDARVQKSLNFTDRYNLALFVNIFNVANHQNATTLTNVAYGVGTPTATTNTLTFNNPANGTGANFFGNVTKTNNQGFLYQQRLIEIGAKFNF